MVDVLTRAEHAEQPPRRRRRAGLPGPARRRRPVRARAPSRVPRARRTVQRCGAHRARALRHRLRRAARELLGVGRGRPPAEARARPAARHHVPLARPRAGRGRPRRRGPAAAARRGRGRALRRPRRSRRPPKSGTSSSATTAPIPNASRSSRKGSTTALLPGRPRRRPALTRRSTAAPIAAVRRAHPAAEGRRPRGRARSPSLRHARATLLVVGGPSGPDGEAELAALHALVDELGLERARAVRPAAAARAARRLLPRRRRVRRALAHASRSGSSRWKPPRAARPWSPPTSVGCGSSSTTA